MPAQRRRPRLLRRPPLRPPPPRRLRLILLRILQVSLPHLMAHSIHAERPQLSRSSMVLLPVTVPPRLCRLKAATPFEPSLRTSAGGARTRPITSESWLTTMAAPVLAPTGHLRPSPRLGLR